MDSLEARVGQLEEAVEALKAEVEALKVRVDRLEKRVDRLEVCTDKLEKSVEALTVKTEALENSVTAAKVMMETEIRRNIQAVADGHHDLYRRLGEVIRSCEQNELIVVRMNVLESDVRNLKAAYAM